MAQILKTFPEEIQTSEQLREQLDGDFGKNFYHTIRTQPECMKDYTHNQKIIILHAFSHDDVQLPDDLKIPYMLRENVGDYSIFFSIHDDMNFNTLHSVHTFRKNFDEKYFQGIFEILHRFLYDLDSWVRKNTNRMLFENKFSCTKDECIARFLLLANFNYINEHLIIHKDNIAEQLIFRTFYFFFVRSIRYIHETEFAMYNYLKASFSDACPYFKIVNPPEISYFKDLFEYYPFSELKGEVIQDKKLMKFVQFLELCKFDE